MDIAGALSLPSSWSFSNFTSAASNRIWWFPCASTNAATPLPDQTAPFRIVDNKMIAAVCIRTEDKNDCTWVPVSVKPISLVECFMEIGYGTDRVKQFHVNFSYGAIGIKQTSSDNALSYLEAMFKEEASFNPFHTKDDTNEIG